MITIFHTFIKRLDLLKHYLKQTKKQTKKNCLKKQVITFNQLNPSNITYCCIHMKIHKQLIAGENAKLKMFPFFFYTL